MRAKNFISHYGGPLVAIILGWAALVGLAVTLGGEGFREKWSGTFVLLFVHWVLISYLAWLAFEFRTVSLSAPEVRHYLKDSSVLIVSPKQWLGISVSVLIYVQEEDYERLTCAGEVVHIQENGLVQVRVEPLREDTERNSMHLLEKVKLSRIILKPGRS